MAMSSTPAANAAARNPVASFYGGQRAVRWLGAVLRAAHRLAPPLGRRLTMRLFFTPLPTKQAARRRPLAAGWRIQALPFEQGTLALWQRERPGSGARVLLVHGWAGDAAQMLPLAESLAAAGFEPVLLDFPGHGRSDGWRSTLPQFVRALFAVTAWFGPWHAGVGHSLGARASAHAAARGLPAQRLALVAPSPPPAPFISWFARSFGLAEPMAQGLRELIEEREGVPLAQFEPAWLGARLAQPTLVVHDRDDRVVPLAATEALVRALPGATLHFTEGQGHRRVLSDAGAAARIVLALKA